MLERPLKEAQEGQQVPNRGEGGPWSWELDEANVQPLNPETGLSASCLDIVATDCEETELSESRHESIINQTGAPRGARGRYTAHPFMPSGLGGCRGITQS